MILLAILGFDPAQNLAWWLCDAHTTNQLKHCDYHGKSYIVNEHKTKDVQGQRPSNMNLSLFVCFFSVCLAT